MIEREEREDIIWSRHGEMLPDRKREGFLSRVAGRGRGASMMVHFEEGMSVESSTVAILNL